ncbi:hypothetical protein JCM18903_1041 [Psychrobacter sp. JCM 18903]|nr:hypothetical protein JCM18903_1041 [Psychrobacter sp. JCM 18903]
MNFVCFYNKDNQHALFTNELYWHNPTFIMQLGCHRCFNMVKKDPLPPRLSAYAGH